MREKPKKIAMLGFAWVTKEGSTKKLKAVVQKISLAVEAGENKGQEVTIRFTGFELRKPDNRFEEAKVVGPFTPMAGLRTALVELLGEPANRRILRRIASEKERQRRHTYQFLDLLAATKMEQPYTFANHA